MAGELESFTAWVDNKLSSIGQPPITNHLIDEPRLSKGKLLSHLLLATRGESLNFQRSEHPAMVRGNIDSVLERWRSDPAISLNTISADNLHDGDSTYVLAFIWQLIRRYDDSAKGISREEWVRRTTQLIQQGKTHLIGGAALENPKEVDPPPAAALARASSHSPQNFRASEPSVNVMPPSPPVTMAPSGASMPPPPPLAAKGLTHDLATIQAKYNPPQQPSTAHQFQRQQIQLMTQPQMVTTMMNGQMANVMIEQQPVLATVAAQSMALTGQQIPVMLEEQQVTVLVQGYPVQMILPSQPVIVVADMQIATTQQQVRITVQPQQVTLYNQGQPVVLMMQIHQIIIILAPQQIMCLQPVQQVVKVEDYGQA